MRGRNDLSLARIDGDVAHLRDRKIERERLPVRARVKAEINSAASAEEQQLRFIRILANVEDKFIFGQTGGDRGPMPAQIGGLEDIRPEIVPHVAASGEIGSLFVRVRRLDAADPGFGQPRRGDDLPILSAVGRNVSESVIRTGPNQDCRREAKPRAQKLVDRSPLPTDRDRRATAGHFRARPGCG